MRCKWDRKTRTESIMWIQWRGPVDGVNKAWTYCRPLSTRNDFRMHRWVTFSASDFPFGSAVFFSLYTWSRYFSLATHRSTIRPWNDARIIDHGMLNNRSVWTSLRNLMIPTKGGCKNAPCCISELLDNNCSYKLMLGISLFRWATSSEMIIRWFSTGLMERCRCTMVFLPLIVVGFWGCRA